MSQPTPQHEDWARSAVEAVQAAWNRAMAEWDVGAVSALYDESAQLFGSLPRLYEGRKGVSRYFSDARADGCEATFENAALRVTQGQQIVVSGFVDFKVRAGETITERKFRFSWVLTRASGDWLIQLHHASQAQP